MCVCVCLYVCVNVYMYIRTHIYIHLCVRTYYILILTQEEFRDLRRPHLVFRTECDTRRPFDADGMCTVPGAELKLLRLEKHKHEWTMFKEWALAGHTKSKAPKCL